MWAACARAVAQRVAQRAVLLHTSVRVEPLWLHDRLKEAVGRHFEAPLPLVIASSKHSADGDAHLAKLLPIPYLLGRLRNLCFALARCRSDAGLFDTCAVCVCGRFALDASR